MLRRSDFAYYFFLSKRNRWYALKCGRQKQQATNIFYKIFRKINRTSGIHNKNREHITIFGGIVGCVFSFARNTYSCLVPWVMLEWIIWRVVFSLEIESRAKWKWQNSRLQQWSVVELVCKVFSSHCKDITLAGTNVKWINEWESSANHNTIHTHKKK